jgi:hypothetical protein
LFRTNNSSNFVMSFVLWPQNCCQKLFRLYNFNVKKLDFFSWYPFEVNLKNKYDSYFLVKICKMYFKRISREEIKLFHIEVIQSKQFLTAILWSQNEWHYKIWRVICTKQICTLKSFQSKKDTKREKSRIITWRLEPKDVCTWKTWNIFLSLHNVGFSFKNKKQISQYIASF